MLSIILKLQSCIISTSPSQLPQHPHAGINHREDWFELSPNICSSQNSKGSIIWILASLRSISSRQNQKIRLLSANLHQCHWQCTMTYENKVTLILLPHIEGEMTLVTSQGSNQWLCFQTVVLTCVNLQLGAQCRWRMSWEASRALNCLSRNICSSWGWLVCLRSCENSAQHLPEHHIKPCQWIMIYPVLSVLLVISIVPWHPTEASSDCWFCRQTKNLMWSKTNWMNSLTSKRSRSRHPSLALVSVNGLPDMALNRHRELHWFAISSAGTAKLRGL